MRWMFLAALTWAAPALAQDLERVSTDPIGAQLADFSFAPVTDATGRLVVFASEADTLVEGDTNGVMDVFLKDRETGAVSRISVASDGTQADGPSPDMVGSFIGAYPSYATLRHDMTPDGRFVSFVSGATNLVEGDTNGVQDAFVHDRVTGVTERVSVTSDGAEGDDYALAVTALSDDGRFVAFASRSELAPGALENHENVYVRDRATGTTELVSQIMGREAGTPDSWMPDISGDGRYVVFVSEAKTLVRNNPSVEILEIYLHDRITGATTLVSLAEDGTASDGLSFGPRISRNGDYILFSSRAGNLVAGDANDAWDMFRRNRATGVTERVSGAADGGDADAASTHGAISDDGAVVAFSSAATNLLADPLPGPDAQVFRRDMTAGTTEILSLGPSGEPGDLGAILPDVNADASVVAFHSNGSTLVSGDTNGVTDVFATGRFGEREPERFEYAAKVLCGIVPPGAEETRIAPGLYTTSVNIHNPGVADVTFFKKLARAVPPGGQLTGGIFPIAEDTLRYDEALNSDCADLRARLFPDSDPRDFFEGFLVIQSPAPLDVTAVFSTAGVDRSGEVTGHSSIDVEVIPARDRAEGCDIELAKEASQPYPPYEFGGLTIAALRYDITLTHSCDTPLTGVQITDEIRTEVGGGFLSGVQILPLIEPVIVEPGGSFGLLDYAVMPDSTTEATMRADLTDIAPGDGGLLAYWVIVVTYGDYYGGPVINTATVETAVFEESAANNTASTTTQF